MRDVPRRFSKAVRLNRRIESQRLKEGPLQLKKAATAPEQFHHQCYGIDKPVSLRLRPAKLGKLQSFISLQCHPDAPFVYKQEQWSFFQIFDLLHIGCTGQTIHIDFLIFDPADMLIRQRFQNDIHTVLIFQTVFQHIELQDADSSIPVLNSWKIWIAPSWAI